MGKYRVYAQPPNIKNPHLEYRILSDNSLNIIYLAKLAGSNLIAKHYRSYSRNVFRGAERAQSLRIKTEFDILSYLNVNQIDTPQLLACDFNLGILTREYIADHPLIMSLKKMQLSEQKDVLFKAGCWLKKLNNLHINASKTPSVRTLYTLETLKSAVLLSLKRFIPNSTELFISLMNEETHSSKPLNNLLWGSCSLDNMYYVHSKSIIIGNDFEFAGYGDYYSDLGCMVMSILREPNLHHQELITAFLDGYSSEPLNRRLIFIWAGVATLIHIAWNGFPLIDGIALFNRIVQQLTALID